MPSSRFQVALVGLFLSILADQPLPNAASAPSRNLRFATTWTDRELQNGKAIGKKNGDQGGKKDGDQGGKKDDDKTGNPDPGENKGKGKGNANKYDGKGNAFGKADTKDQFGYGAPPEFFREDEEPDDPPEDDVPDQETIDAELDQEMTEQMEPADESETDPEGTKDSEEIENSPPSNSGGNNGGGKKKEKARDAKAQPADANEPADDDTNAGPGQKKAGATKKEPVVEVVSDTQTAEDDADQPKEKKGFVPSPPEDRDELNENMYLDEEGRVEEVEEEFGERTNKGKGPKV